MTGGITAPPHDYMVSAVRKGINEWRKTVARKLISAEVDSILPDSQSLPTLQSLAGGTPCSEFFAKLPWSGCSQDLDLCLHR